MPLKIFVAGLVLSALAALGWHRWVRMQTARELALAAADLEAEVHARMQAYLALLHGTRGLLVTAHDVGRMRFKRYVSELAIAREYPGIQGIGFSRRVEAGALEDFVAATRANNRAGFRVWPDQPRAEYHAIVYLEPEDARNLAAIGYDMHTDAVRRAAMDRARDTGEPAMSGKVSLVQEIDLDKQAGFLVYLPIYTAGEIPATVEQRRERLVGFVYAPFRAADLMAAVTGREELGFDFAVYDGAPDPAAVLYAHEPSPRFGGTHVRRTRTLQVANRPWTLVYAAPVATFWSVAGILLGGVVISGGVARLVGRERRASRRAERSAEQTAQRERELALLVEWVPALVKYVDRDGILRLCNRHFADFFGVEPEALTGRPLRDVLGPKIHAGMEPLIARAMAGEPVTDERWHNLPRAGARYLATNYVPLRAPDGRPNGFYSLVSDLTALKRAEERARFVADCGKLLISSMDYEATARGVVHLAVPHVADLAVLFRMEDAHLRATAVAHADAEMERRLAAFLEPIRIDPAAPHGVATAARSGTVVVTEEVQPAHLVRATSEPAVRAMLERLALRSAMHVPVVVRGRVWAVLSMGTSEQSGRRFADEDRRLAEEIATRMQLAVENALLFVEAQQEVEERRRAERTARETEERFGLLVAGARDYAIILIDVAGRIESWNEGAERIFGFAEEEAVGLPLAALSSAEDRAAGIVEDELARARSSESALDERWYVRKDGTRFWASGHTVAMRDEEREIRGYAKIMRDLTEQKRTEEELERRVKERTTELNEAIQELEAFSYSVSHDLRSPLRSIRGFTELALEEAGPRLTETERGYLERVQRAVARLDRLISDLLAYTRVSKTKVELRPVDVHALLTDIWREHPEFQAPRADVRIAGDMPAVVGHETYLTQVLTNLLGNAVKFVKPGQRPVVQIWSERRGDMVRLFVRDNGIGIPAQHLPRAFEMFERLHTHSGYEGTGVGLAIVRRAVQRMNGVAGLESVEGEGTTFWIDLPAAKEPVTVANERDEAEG